MASPEPFIPRVLRSEYGTVAVQLNPATMGHDDIYELVALGPDGIGLARAWGLREQTGLVTNLQFLMNFAPDVLAFHELTP
jgi:hypothetical protein